MEEPVYTGTKYYHKKTLGTIILTVLVGGICIVLPIILQKYSIMPYQLGSISIGSMIVGIMIGGLPRFKIILYKSRMELNYGVFRYIKITIPAHIIKSMEMVPNTPIETITSTLIYSWSFSYLGRISELKPGTIVVKTNVAEWHINTDDNKKLYEVMHETYQLPRSDQSDEIAGNQL